MKLIESIFEGILWNSRFFVLLAVISSMVGGIALFIVASTDVLHVAKLVFNVYFNGLHPHDFHENLVTDLIGAVDLYLIAIVLFIFSFGLYELFISPIDIAEKSAASKILEIKSLDDLESKLAKVIVMVMIVSFFKKVLHTQFNGALEMLYFAIAIFILALALYFMHKGEGKKHG